MRRNIARGLLARRIPPALVGGLEVFLRSDGTWVPWAAFQDQLDTFGDVWAITSMSALVGPPLDLRGQDDGAAAAVVVAQAECERSAKRQQAADERGDECDGDDLARAHARPL